LIGLGVWKAMDDKKIVSSKKESSSVWWVPQWNVNSIHED
jgi:hypothetical protein